ncbi:glycoside hydrolase family 20 zincin-like fold domain-containing protein [Cellulomonas sp. JZ18]|uniref:glycoside hydrolase family 20 zincin-like fold domain-containing protein n=1 Tax=Cellulomonas sp. JZ18 TaxID=2654191 RepID=UPI001E3C6C39|nr:glycoside hydrolase family 20 zincin-like fold domain-containing protein [Cellulomonas sp. JZ18]
MSDVIAVVPQPLVVEPEDAAPYVVTAATVVVVPAADADDPAVPAAVLAADLLGRAAGHAVQVRFDDPGVPGAVHVRLVPAGSAGLPAGDEAYRVLVGPDAVRLEACAPRGSSTPS